MTIFRASLLVLLTLLLAGCATISSEGKYTIVETTQRKDYQERHFSGIEAVSLNGSKILLHLVDKSLYEVKAGKSEWRDTLRIHKILVSGLNKDYEFSKGYKGTIDLSPYILNTDLTKNTTIKITCLDCDSLGQEDQTLFKYVRRTVEVTADFSAIKADLIKIRKESQGVPLKEFKAQCQALGFKLGSTEYGNCVLELNEAK
jgi:hypothetical protein